MRTTRESIATRTVVNAAGPWAAGVAELAGVDLPVEPLRRMLVPTEPFSQVSHTSPMVVDMATGFHFRPEGLGLLLAWNDPEETPGFKTEFDRGVHRKDPDARGRPSAVPGRSRGESAARVGWSV